MKIYDGNDILLSEVYYVVVGTKGWKRDQESHGKIHAEKVKRTTARGHERKKMKGHAKYEQA